jgi:hypothetical protein
MCRPLAGVEYVSRAARLDGRLAVEWLMVRVCRSRTYPKSRTRGLDWAITSPSPLDGLTDRVDTLEQRLRQAQDELGALGDEANSMLCEAESALALALALIGEEMPSLDVSELPDDE